MDADPQLTPAILAGFVGSVGILALPAEGQIAWLQGLPVKVGAIELALSFEDEYLQMPLFLAAGWLSPQAEATATTVDRLLDEMSADPEPPWTFDEVRTDPRWAAVRDAAFALLCAITGSSPRTEPPARA